MFTPSKISEMTGWGWVHAEANRPKSNICSSHSDNDIL